MGKQRIRVLVIDGEANQREPVIDLLQNNNLYVDAAADTDQAWMLVSQSGEPYDLVLINDLLPDGAGEPCSSVGLKTVAKIKALCPATEVIVFIDQGATTIEKVLCAGASRYLTKPLNLTELALLVLQVAEELKVRVSERQTLERLIETNAALLAGQSEGDVLGCILKAVQSLGFDRARMYQLADDGTSLICKAQAGGHEDANNTWFITRDQSLLTMLLDGRPHVFTRMADQPSPCNGADNGRRINEFGCVPLVLRGQVIGQLVVDNEFSQRPIVERELERLTVFSSQAAAAIQNTRSIRDAERHVRSLSTILKVSSTISSSLNLNRTLKAACRAAVELLGVDHSGLVLFSPDQKTGQVRAEYPEDMAARGLEIPLLGVPSEERLIRSRKPVVINDVAGDSLLGPVRDLLIELGICSAVIVPIIVKNRVVGSLSLDAIGRKRTFKNEEIELCKVFASQVAIAIKNAQLFDHTRGQVRKLQALQHTTLAMNSTLDRRALFGTIIREAVWLLKATSGGIYEYFPEHRELIVIADYNRPQHLNNRLKLGEGMAGRLVESEQPFMIIDDYNRWEGKAHIYADSHPFGAVLGVPLKWKEHIIGILYIDDKVGRRFTPDDARLLGLFADQAALALANAEYVAQDEEKLKRLEGLSRATTDIMRATTLEARLALITKYTAEILEAEACSTYLVKRDGSLSLEASYGDAQVVVPGAEAAVENGDRAGLSTWHQVAPGPGSGSVLKLELKQKKAGQEEKLIGMLCLENKKVQADCAFPPSFSKADEWVLNVMAETIVVAIENAGLVTQLGEQKETLKLLLRASNSLSEASDLAQGLDSLADMMVKLLSHTFCRILLLDEKGSSLKVMAASFIARAGGSEWEPGAGRAIPLSAWPGLEKLLNKGRPIIVKLPQSRHQLVAFSDMLRLRQPVQSLLLVPLKIKDKLVGLIDLGEVRSPARAGFTEETIKLAKSIAAQTASLIDRMYLNYISERSRTELEHLLQAVHAMSGAFDLNQVLQTIVESVKEVLCADSAAIWSYDSGLRRFIPEELVAVGIPEEELRLFREEEPEPGRTAYTVLHRGWLGVTDISLAAYDFLGDRTRELLGRISVRSFQGTLLKVNEEPVGVLYVNYRTPRVFEEEDNRSLYRLAKYTALSLKKARLLDQVKKVQKAAQVVAKMMALGQLDATLDSIIQGTLEVVDCQAAVLYVYDSTSGSLSPPVTQGVHYSDRVSGYKDVPNSLVYAMLQRNEPHIVERIEQDPLFAGARFARDEEIKSCLAIPLQAAEQKVGVLFVNYRTRHRFTADERTSVELFANQAAVAIRNAQLYESVKRHGASLQALYRAGKAITAGWKLGRKPMLDRIVEQAVECVTAGKGLAVAFGTIQLYDEARDELHFESTCCSQDYPEVRARLGEVRSLKQEVSAGRIGISGRTVLSKTSQIVGDVRQDPDYVQFDPLMRSALTVPLIDKEKVLGVLGLESNRPRAFDDDDMNTLLGLAELAVIAIRNAQQYDDLRRTQTLAEARTALAWMGMTSSTWRHAVHGHAITINDLVELATSALDNRSLAEVRQKLARISDMASLIQKHPITAPLSSEESVRSVLVNALLRERLGQLLESGTYKHIILRFDLALPGRAAVRANPDWLRRALDILVDNAIEAMKDSDQRVLTVSSQYQDKSAHIAITDTGKGIPPGVREKLLHMPIEHSGDSKNLGLGLLLARLIVQVYGGDISCQSTGPGGTTMVITLPLEAESVKM